MNTNLCLASLALLVTGVLCVPSYRTKTTCEGRTAYLKCRSGYTISVISAKYGRTDTATCPHKRIRTTYCSSRSSLAIVRSSCNGLRSCKVLAKNSVFGDPCKGTYKYLKVRYVCKKVSRGGIMRSITCEKKKRSLSCRSGRVLDIVSANYGRTDSNTCPHKAIRTIHCLSAASYSVRKQCQGHRSCRLYASNKVFGDPCVGTYKYLDVQYRCVAYQEPKTYSRTICESKSTTIACPSNMKLNIEYASYGRSDAYTCRRYGRMRDINCSATGCVDRVKKYCQGYHSCTVKASNSIFGDPCFGTYKYLKLKYQCVH